jgi:hypothetical protein
MVMLLPQNPTSNDDPGWFYTQPGEYIPKKKKVGDDPFAIEESTPGVGFEEEEERKEDAPHKANEAKKDAPATSTKEKVTAIIEGIPKNTEPKIITCLRELCPFIQREVTLMEEIKVPVTSMTITIPTGTKIIFKEYHSLTEKISFEANGIEIGIANHMLPWPIKIHYNQKNSLE